LHRPGAPGLVIGAILPLLELITPVLFFGGIVALHLRLEGGSRRLGLMGLLACLLGTVLGVIHGVYRWPTMPYSGEWLSLLLVSLMVMGMAMLVADGRRFLGASVLASGTLGWVSMLTDPASSIALVPLRQVHVAFPALFCISTILLVQKPLSSGPRPRPQ
jgi:hypothetical protein